MLDRRTLLAIALCFGITYAWQKYYLEPRTLHPAPVTQMQQATPEQETAKTTQSTPPAQMSQAPAAPRPEQPARPHETRTLNTSVGTAQIGDDGRIFTNWNLKGYRLGISAEAAAVDLKSVTNENGDLELAFDDPTYAYLNGVQGSFSQGPNGLVWTYEDGNVKMTREFASDGQLPYMNVTLKAEFKKKAPTYAFVSLVSHDTEKDSEEKYRELVYFTNNSIEREQTNKISQVKEIATNVRYIGTADRYFLMTAVAQGPLSPRGLLQPAGAQSGRVSMAYAMPGGAISIPLRVYFGPKEVSTLRAVDPELTHALNFGWFTLFADWILVALKFLYGIVHNYGVAIIILTVALKIITYPLTYKSMKSMREMAKLQPQLQKLREKHKDDKEALNREMMAMMKTHGYNPAAGCLPSVIQIPIFFALDRVLYAAIELYHAPFAFWIQDLSAKDPYYVTPILLSGLMYLQQKITPNTATDPTQQKMMQFMPVMFGLFMIALPSGLTLYMLANAAAGIVQLWFLNKKLDTGNVAAVPARAR